MYKVRVAQMVFFRLLKSVPRLSETYAFGEVPSGFEPLYKVLQTSA